METVTFGGKTYSLDDHGFLDPPDQWDEGFAEGMAHSLGIRGGLTGRHWEFLRYLRKKFLDEETVPVVVQACADNRMRLSELRARFPTGYHRGACKIAGINYKFMYDLNHWLTYETAPPAKPRYRLDPLGFLDDFDDWDEDFARDLGDYTDLHRQVILFLRDHHGQHGGIPTVYETCRANGLSMEDLIRLFPAGYRRGACRAAGLPFFP